MDDSGVLDITDTIYLLNFLFLGGQAPKPPFEEIQGSTRQAMTSSAAGTREGRKGCNMNWRFEGLSAIWFFFFLSVRLSAGEGKIIGWGAQVVGVDLDSSFKAVAVGAFHSLGLKKMARS